MLPFPSAQSILGQCLGACVYNRKRYGNGLRFLKSSSLLYFLYANMEPTFWVWGVWYLVSSFAERITKGRLRCTCAGFDFVLILLSVEGSLYRVTWRW